MCTHVNCLSVEVWVLAGWQNEPTDALSTASSTQNRFYFQKSPEEKINKKSPGTVYLMLCFWMSLMQNSMLSSLKIKNNPFLLLCWVFSKKFMRRWKQTNTMPNGSVEIPGLWFQVVWRRFQANKDLLNPCLELQWGHAGKTSVALMGWGRLRILHISILWFLGYSFKCLEFIVCDTGFVFVFELELQVK